MGLLSCLLEDWGRVKVATRVLIVRYKMSSHEWRGMPFWDYSASLVEGPVNVKISYFYLRVEPSFTGPSPGRMNVDDGTAEWR
jgi:hypothetical protein